MITRSKLLLVAVTALVSAVVLPSAHSATSPEVVVAILDTGIRPSHETFGATQTIAWYDFGRSGGADEPTTLWDSRIAPYDDHGHGTAVASMVGGQNRASQTPSYAPGVRLAIAKISNSAGAASWANVARAIRWATNVVGADIISLSFYAYLPQLGNNHELLKALEVARQAGVLPVVLAGNGMGNSGLPAVSWMHPPATSPDALVVGGAKADGTPVAPLGSTDAEVTCLYSVVVASSACNTCYRSWAGTSFSTPLVAGTAASLIQTALNAGIAQPSADSLEMLLKRSARETIYPPSIEGYGFLDSAALQTARAALLSGQPPSRDLQGEASAIYVESVQDALRAIWWGRADRIPQV